MTNMNLGWLGPILCLFHLLSTPFFFIKRWDNGRFIANYIVYTVVIVALIFGSLHFLPDDMGFAGMVFLYPLLIPIVFTAPLTILTRTFFFYLDARRGAEEDISRRAASARPGTWPPAGAAFPAKTVSALPDSPKARRMQALKQILWIEALSFVALMTFAYLKFTGATVLSTIFPDFVSDAKIMGDSLLPQTALTMTVEDMIVNIAAVEIVWQYWTRKVSQPPSILFSRPIKYHVLALIPLGLLPVLQYPFLRDVQFMAQRENQAEYARERAIFVPAKTVQPGPNR